MGTFSYIAYDREGVRHQGELSGLNAESAKFKIKELGMIPTAIVPVNTAASRFHRLGWLERRPGLGDIEFMTSQIAILLKNGIKIDKALEIARKGIKNSRLKKTVDEVYNDVRRGTPLSLAIEKKPEVFDPLYVSSVKIGEATGELAKVFANLAANLNFRRKIHAKTRQAMVYPGIIFIVCLLSIVFIFDFIVPKFAVIFADMPNIPFYTEILLKVSRLFRRYQYFIPVVAAGIAILLAKSGKKERVKRVVDALLLKLPVTRQLSYTLENLRFVSSLAILLKSGVLLNDALGYAVHSVSNFQLRKRLLTVKNEIQQGKKFSQALEKTDFLPEIFDALLEVGEQTGNLAEVLTELENRLQDNYENLVAALITIIEPVVIIFMSLIVGSVVIVMLLSMVSINDINF